MTEVSSKKLKKQSEGSEPVDRLSELPDSIIHVILSLLPMECVVRTTILSKRWKDFWTSVPCLEFTAMGGELEKFRHFVSQALMLWSGEKMQKITFLTDFLFDESLYHEHNLWVRLALAYKVEEIYVHHFFSKRKGCWMPQNLFSSSYIKKLDLMGCDLEVHGNVCWDNLKTLEIDSYDLSQIVIHKMLSGSPKLEILTLRCGENLSIHSASLKKLSIDYNGEDYYEYLEEPYPELIIWTPNLEALSISGSVCNEHFILYAPSLVEADFRWFYCPTYNDKESLSDYELHGEMLKEIFESINQVEKLCVGDWFIKVLTVMKKAGLPSPLLNVKSLILETRLANGCLAGIVNLIEILPNLAVLDIANRPLILDEEELIGEWDYQEESLIPEFQFSDSFLKQLRILQIRLLRCDHSIFSLGEFLLKNACMLEKIVFTVLIKTEWPESLIRDIRKLLRMPRSSPSADVIFCRYRTV